MMTKVKVVTGYIPLPIKNLSEVRFRELGYKLIEAVYEADIGYITVFDENDISECSLYRDCKFRAAVPSAKQIPEDRFPDPWTMTCSNIIQCQKPEWVNLAMDYDDDFYGGKTDVYVWIDYGIFKQQGINKQVIVDFLRKIQSQPKPCDIVAPGLIGACNIDMGVHHTRFCGSVVVVPRALVPLYNMQMTELARRDIRETGTISWDVNYLALCERLDLLPIRQYKAWWNETQFTNYPEM